MAHPAATGGDKMLLMAQYDLCLTWCWEYDADFIRLLDSACQAHELTLLQVTPAQLGTFLQALESGELKFTAFLDRTEHEAPYEPFFRWSREQDIFRINPRELADWAEDKATMHLELIQSGLITPYTIILPPFAEQPGLPVLDLSPLGECFVIKPSYGGGGEGVYMGVTSMEQVLNRRQEYPHLKYLLQQTITPDKFDGREAWFRVIYCDKQCYLCWWDPATHIYNTVEAEEETRYGLAPLRDITARIAELCRLSFFSTEIAFSRDKQWVVIDYVNDQIDMRLKSQALDGVPDVVVERVSFDLARLIKRKCG